MRWSSTLSRGIGAFACTAILILSSIAGATPPESRPVQRPQQVIPTGAEDGKAAVRRGASVVRAPKDQRIAELEAMTNQSSEGLRVVKRRDGVRMVDLQGRFMHVSLALPTADGSVVRTCSTGGDVIDRLIAAHAPKPATPAFRFALEVE